MQDAISRFDRITAGILALADVPQLTLFDLARMKVEYMHEQKRAEKQPETKSIEVKERSVEQKIADAVACCAAVAKLYKRYGGAFVQLPANKQPKTRLAFRGPRNTMKRRLPPVKPVQVPRHIFCYRCRLPFHGTANNRCQCKRTVERRRAG